MIYLLLLAILIIFFIVIYVDRDIFSPSAIICESYLLAVCCAIVNIKVWNIDLNSQTVFLILLGIFVFVAVSLFIVHTTIKKKEPNKRGKIKFIRVNKFNYKILVFIQILTVIIYFIYVVKAVGGLSSFTNFSNLMNYYRENTAYGELETGIPTYVNQLVKISKILGYISTYIIIRNTLIAKRKKEEKKEKNILYIISIFSFVVLSLLSGGRFGLISYVLGVLVMWMTLKDRIYEIKTSISLRQVLKIICFILVVMIIFSNLRGWVGRKNDDNFIQYISSYFGGSIQLFDMFLNSPIPKSEIFGKETFYGINRTLAQLGIIEPYKMHLEFRESNGIVIGNVYTSFRNFYYDFGTYGIVILQIVMAIFWSIYYKKIKKEKNVCKFDYPLIIYCMFIDKLFLHSYRDTFYSTVLTVSMITIIIYLFVIKKIIIKEGEEDGEK